MQIIWNINNYQSEDGNVVSLGTFDGIHLGHQAILAQLQQKAKELDLRATMITFEPHPQLVVQRNASPSVRILTTIEEKIQILSDLGLDRLVVVQFTPALAGMKPERFIEEILLQRLHMKQVVIGHDHAFGHGRSGNRELLLSFGQKMGFTVTALPPVEQNGMIVSSTQVRNMLLNGRVKNAAALLGRPFAVSGQVISGDSRGRQLGYPTINIRPYSQYKLVPQTGIYATKTIIDTTVYNSVTYLGERPTFSTREKQIETHIFDFNEDVYGKEVAIEFIEFIREDKKFADSMSLIGQIKEDLRISMELLQKNAS